MSRTSSYSGGDGKAMKFELTAQQPVAPSGGPDGSFDVMPEAVHAILVDVQAAASEFEELLAAAGAGMAGLSDACKAPPVSRELSTFSTFLLANTIRSAEGRIAVASGAVSEAVLALIQADEQMNETARRSAALAAQDAVDDAPGTAGRARPAGHGPAQAF
ncbi:hypothetical protein QNO00_05085 [Arthrobacter sp. zg-Y1219]|uniref:DUF6507 family protein n=1 Tax=Arthrobacter sp. zg-Y1219 TaxID=3049067 RepID=UPI0024C2F4B2|nr:hypothetical protein [Arthrobacter sp. zg-Y1219]MDK1359639.1 hypothetical protein [Arthrobacter sp. zg-Y1219]